MCNLDNSSEELNHPEMAEDAIELINAIRLISRPENRALLERHTDDTFRCHQIEASNPRAVLGALSASFLIEDSGRQSGSTIDWTTSARGERLLLAMDEHSIYITEIEADALHTFGSRSFLLPHADTWWTTSDVDVDLHPRELRTLADAGLVEREIDTRAGYNTVWRCRERLEQIANLTFEVLTDE